MATAMTALHYSNHDYRRAAAPPKKLQLKRCQPSPFREVDISILLSSGEDIGAGRSG